MSSSRVVFLMACGILLTMGCQRDISVTTDRAAIAAPPTPRPTPAHLTPRDRVVAHCVWQTQVTHGYDPAYTSLRYPGGDVDIHTGVCADVIVRSFRAAGVDLQKAVHEDMQAHFGAYPRLWGLRRPDSSIDHRRVANLMTFFQRHGDTVRQSQTDADFAPGDIVAWRLPNNRLHIGIVTDATDPEKHIPLLVHNVGAGARLENVLFAWPVIGHYRYFK